jgi:hypothetical protein
VARAAAAHARSAAGARAAGRGGDLSTSPKLFAHIGETSVEVPLDHEPSSAGTIAETTFVELALAPVEPETEYRILIGNEPVESAAGDGVGDIAGKVCAWPATTPFESALGRTFLRVESRRDDASWLPRGGIIVNVSPTKLGEARYRALFDELRDISPALVHDVTGKSARALHAGAMSAIAGEWRAAQRALERFAHTRRAPVRRTDDRRALLLARLHDPARRPDVRALAAGLDLLARRADAIRGAATEALEEIRRDRADTDIRVAARGASLYDVREAPRVARLEEVAAAANAVAADIRSSRAAEPFGRAQLSVRARTAAAPGTSLGDAADALRRTARAMAAVAGGSYRRPTSSLYESWVFLRIVRAFATVARSADPLDALIDALRRRRFGVGVPAVTTTTFRLYDGRSLAITFEPFIRVRAEAAAHGDELCREDIAAAPLTPDVLIVLRDERIRRVAIVDAKYIARPRPDVWHRLARYSFIRHTATGRSAGADVWLAAPISTETGDDNIPEGWRGGLLPLLPASGMPQQIPRGDGAALTFTDPGHAGSRGRHHAAERDGAARTAARFARWFVSPG